MNYYYNSVNNINNVNTKNYNRDNNQDYKNIFLINQVNN